jgi:hypothetical protein
MILMFSLHKLMQHLVKPIGYKYNKRNDTWLGTIVKICIPTTLKIHHHYKKSCFSLLQKSIKKTPIWVFLPPLFNLTKVLVWMNQFQHSLFD